MGVDQRRLTDRGGDAVLRVIWLFKRLAIIAAIGTSVPAQTLPTAPQVQIANPQPVATPPVPKTVSSKAQQDMQEYEEAQNSSQKQPFFSSSVAEQRAFWDRRQKTMSEDMLKSYPVQIEESKMAGVPVLLLSPMKMEDRNRARILINVHGGAFNTDAGSLVENIPIVYLSGIRVIAVKYRLAPENPFPAAVEDAIAVYNEVLKNYKPQNIGLYGTSAGAALTAETAAKIKQLGLPMPAALGFFSGWADFSLPGDSMSWFTIGGLAAKKSGDDLLRSNPYVGHTDLKDPVLSPLYSDLKGYPRTLCITGTRDFLLSGTTLYHRALLHAGVDAELVVFEAMPHAHWIMYHDTPEAAEAFSDMARFFDQKVGGSVAGN
jgi:monoterpene epsilon-lactone hydrolase